MDSWSTARGESSIGGSRNEVSSCGDRAPRRIDVAESAVMLGLSSLDRSGPALTAVKPPEVRRSSAGAVEQPSSKPASSGGFGVSITDDRTFLENSSGNDSSAPELWLREPQLLAAGGPTETARLDILLGCMAADRRRSLQLRAPRIFDPGTVTGSATVPGSESSQDPDLPARRLAEAPWSAPSSSREALNHADLRAVRIASMACRFKSSPLLEHAADRLSSVPLRCPIGTAAGGIVVSVSLYRGAWSGG